MSARPTRSHASPPASSPKDLDPEGSESAVKVRVRSGALVLVEGDRVRPVEADHAALEKALVALRRKPGNNRENREEERQTERQREMDRSREGARPLSPSAEGSRARRSGCGGRLTMASSA